METKSESPIILARDNLKLQIRDMQIYRKHSFAEYLQSGWQISLSVAIDYTQSNGHRDHPTSLHYQQKGKPSPYERAMRAVGNVLEYYDKKRSFPVYGFGGVPSFVEEECNEWCFPLTGVDELPEIRCIEGVIELYRHTLSLIELSGPTYLSHVLNNFLKHMRLLQGAAVYQVLLILTDGDITDMKQTKDFICELANFPCSIVIVGIGNAGFHKMD